MFEGFKNVSWPAKLVTIFVLGVLLGLGLCGVGATIDSRSSNVAGGFFVVGAFSFWLSLLGLVLSLLCLFLFGLRHKDRR